MASLSLEEIIPRRTISKKTTPQPLQIALKTIFSESGEGLWLVGGTALAGYYAEHRRSDDLDLFAMDTDAHRSAVLAVKNLKRRGVVFKKETSTPNFYKAHLELEAYFFTVDIVLDENLHRVGRAIRTEDGVFVVDLPTLFSMKVACLLTRCSEKDLYDLVWCFDRQGEIDVGEIVKMGLRVDGGMNVEGMLVSLQGATLREEACHFLLDNSKANVRTAYQQIVGLQKKLIQLLLDYEKRKPLSPETKALLQAVRDQKRLKK
ncbi:MAG: nucleotidyl transferase AbiEii/AbiGii toxin family protein [Deltaproteobacteria bacterium]|nr:nucleotidyl transferase AbiEii/AbiGii toxin family protein [Deltaproteobacteria bacterium]